jgi:protein-disulfide isomerase
MYGESFSVRMVPFVSPDDPAGQRAHAGWECANASGWGEPYREVIERAPILLTYADPALAVADSLDRGRSEEFRSCLRLDRLRGARESVWSDAVSMGILSTPTIFIEGRRIVGVPPFPVLDSLIGGEIAPEPK